jgi:hypothetical protein
MEIGFLGRTPNTYDVWRVLTAEMLEYITLQGGQTSYRTHNRITIGPGNKASYCVGCVGAL